MLVGEFGVAAYTADGGTTWQVFDTGTKKTLLALAHLGRGTFLTAGLDGTLMRLEPAIESSGVSPDSAGQDTARDLVSPTPYTSRAIDADTTEHFFAVSAVNDGRAIAAGRAVLRLVDGDAVTSVDVDESIQLPFSWFGGADVASSGQLWLVGIRGTIASGNVTEQESGLVSIRAALGRSDSIKVAKAKRRYCGYAAMNHRLAAFIARHPLLVFSVMAALTAIPAYFAVRGLSFDVVLEEMMPLNARNVELVQRFGAQFGGANTTLVEIRTSAESIYSLEFLQKYKRIADDIYYHPESIRHLNQNLALRKTKAVSGGGGRVEINAIMWPDLPGTPEEMATFRRGVNNQYRGFLVSDDERSAMIIADFNDTADFEKVLSFLQGLRTAEEDETTSIHIVGRPVLLGYIYQSLDQVYKILAVSLGIIAAILFLYFHTWIGVVVPIFTAGVATVWGLGAMGYVNYNLDPLLILLPAFIFAIVLSHGVQLTSRVLEKRREG